MRACFEEGIFYVYKHTVVTNDDVAERDKDNAHDETAQQFCELLTLLFVLSLRSILGSYSLLFSVVPLIRTGAH